MKRIFTRMVLGAALLAGGVLPALAQGKMVTLADVTQGDAAASIWVSGTVASRQQAALSAEVSGRVEWIAEFGSRVKAGTSCCVSTALHCSYHWNRRGPSRPSGPAMCVMPRPSLCVSSDCTTRRVPQPASMTRPVTRWSRQRLPSGWRGCRYARLRSSCVAAISSPRSMEW